MLLVRYLCHCLHLAATDYPKTPEPAPQNLHLPQFTYTEPANLTPAPAGVQPDHEDTHSQGFAFSALFQSSNGSSSSPGLSILRSRSSPHPARPVEEDITASFIGFSWGPTLEAFPTQDFLGHSDHSSDNMNTPRPLRLPSTYLTPNPSYITPRWSSSRPSTNRYSTPIRPSAIVAMTPLQTLQRTSTIRRTGAKRDVSDREAMKQLVDCVGMSARKKVLESGRKPRVLTSFSRSGTLKKELRFLPSSISVPDYGDSNPVSASVQPRAKPKPILINNNHHHAISSGSEDTDSEGPPSPSPSPRPGSAMSIISRRSGTPTVSSTRMGMSTILLGIPRSASGRSLSFSRSIDLSLPEATVENLTFEEMEDKLASMLSDIRGMEAKLQHVTNMIR